MGQVTCFEIKLAEIQPSQLFISAEKLKQVIQDFFPLSLETFPPLPVKRLGGDVVLTDGHTRALAAHLGGLKKVRVFWDGDDLDWEAYGVCVEWCKEAGVRAIADLSERVVSAEKYAVLWHRRCDQMHQDLAWRRGLVAKGEGTGDVLR